MSLANVSQWLDIFLIFAMPVFLWGASPVEMAFIASIFGLPSLFLGPFIGAYLDRANPYNTLKFGAVLRVVMTFAIVFSFDILSFGILILFKAIANVIFWPSCTILTNHLVTPDERVSFFSLQSRIDQIIKIVTPVIAGFIVVISSYDFTFCISALFSLLCICALFGLKHDYEQKTEKRDLKSLWQAVLSGMSAMKDLASTLKLTIILSVGMSLALSIYDPHLSAFFKAHGLGEHTFSLAMSLTGVGAVLGAISVQLWFSRTQALNLVRVGLLFFTTSLLLINIVIFGFPTFLTPTIVGITWLLNGLGYELFVIGTVVNMQNHCPQDLLGRISTSVRSMKMTCVVLAPSIGAFLMTVVGENTPFLASLLLCLVLVVTLHTMYQKASD